MKNRPGTCRPGLLQRDGGGRWKSSSAAMHATTCAALGSARRAEQSAELTDACGARRIAGAPHVSAGDCAQPAGQMGPCENTAPPRCEEFERRSHFSFAQQEHCSPVAGTNISTYGAMRPVMSANAARGRRHAKSALRSRVVDRLLTSFLKRSRTTILCPSRSQCATIYRAFAKRRKFVSIFEVDAREQALLRLTLNGRKREVRAYDARLRGE